MNTIFTTDDPSDYIDKINLDELFEKKQQHDLATTNNYKTILNRIHNKIKTTARQQISDQFCWFVVPEVMIGVPKFDVAICVAYIIDQLQNNGFKVRYTHPNLLFISWQHWIPSYVRTEIKKKTGVNVDGYGNVKTEDSENSNKNDLTPNNLLKNKIGIQSIHDSAKPIDTYKPSGKLIYNNDIINSVKNNLK